MKYIILIISFFFVNVSLAQNKAKIDSIVHSNNKSILLQISELEKKIDIDRNINDKTFNSISLQISAASYTLTIMGIALAVIAILIGVYVTYVERKIIKIGEENKNLLLKNQKIKEDVENVNRLIQSDIHGLFEKIKREETLDLLNRLKKVPKDVLNTCTLLLSRELVPEDFDNLKQAYLNLINHSDYEVEEHYKTLFFQHFFSKAITDDVIRKEMVSFIPRGIKNCFENDIMKIVVDFVAILMKKGIPEFAIEINKFFEGLSNSDFKTNTQVYKMIFGQLNTRENRFDLINIIDTKSQTRFAKIQLGFLLIQEYSTSTLTDTESLSLKNIKETENQMIKEEAEIARQKRKEQQKTRAK